MSLPSFTGNPIVDAFVLAALMLSVMLTIQASYTLYIMLYTWDRPDAYAKARAPETFVAPRKTFTVLLPARHEEDVIQMTIERVARANYPKELMEAVVICSVDDVGTIGKAREKIAELATKGYTNFRVATFDDKPINKPHGLIVGLRSSTNEVVTIFDSEDDVHPEIFNIVNTVMLAEGVNVVQSGVQLMNYETNWYSTHNVLEYFFWFKSRLHYHAKIGMIPLGGNTVFFTRGVLERVGGWDENNLTEDADIGIRISCLREKVRVVYDDRYVTREETPPTLGHFVRQRTRWSQGFLQTLRKGTWKCLPSFEQRLLALYTLGFPSAQSVLGLYVPTSLLMIFTIRTPVLVAMVLTLPVYLLVAHFAMSLIGLMEFTGAHGMKLAKRSVLVLTLTYLPYQWVLSYSALRAFFRELKGINNWEKTAHVGAHRQGIPPPAELARAGSHGVSASGMPGPGQRDAA